MGTQYTVKLVVEGEVDRAATNAAIADVLDKIEDAMSTWRTQSDISRFNRHADGDWFAVSSHVIDVMAEALEVSELSDGAFDVTVAPLVELWGFGKRAAQDQLPEAAQIAAARTRVGNRKLAVRAEPAAVRKSVPDLRVNLSAIAKGYAVDKLAEILDYYYINNYMVEIGGEVRTI